MNESIATATCDYKHAIYSPDGPKWRCPSCGSLDIIIESSLNDDCDLLHDDDEIRCQEFTCEYESDGKTMSRKLAKVDMVVKCPTCKGKGVIPDTSLASNNPATDTQKEPRTKKPRVAKTHTTTEERRDARIAKIAE